MALGCYYRVVVTIAKLKYMFFGKKTESYKNIKKKTQDEYKSDRNTVSIIR